MKTIVLDATQLSRDYMCGGLPYQLIEHMFHASWINVYVPASVFEETVANFDRATREAAIALEKLNRSHRILGLPTFDAATHEPEFDYRAYLAERFDECLGITVLPWPSVNHEDLVKRAVHRRRPFDAKGGGYRDSLLWSDIVDLARRGHDVALVSNDKTFADGDGGLAKQLAAEVESLPGAVELVSDFGAWLVSILPWKESDLKSAVARSRDEDFWNYYAQSDLQDSLMPEIEDLGFTQWPISCEIGAVDWDGFFDMVEASEGPNGLVLVEYDLGQQVEFEATFADAFDLEPDWNVTEPDAFGEVLVSGTVELVVRMAVLFGDEFGFSIEELSWRRADGQGTDLMRLENDPDQLSLFDDAHPAD